MSTPSEVTRRAAPPAETVTANRTWWDGEAAGYYVEHGEFLGDTDFVWGPERLREEEAAGEVAVRNVLERLGPPEEIVEAAEPAQEVVQRPTGKLEVAAMVTLVVPFIGWLFGIDLDLILRRQDNPERPGIGNVLLEHGRLGLERLDVDLPSGGRVRGSIALDGRAEVPKLDLSLTLDNVDSAAAGQMLGVARAPRARLAAEIETTGSGSSIAAIVGDLAGTLRIGFGEGSVPPPAGRILHVGSRWNRTRR